MRSIVLQYICTKFTLKHAALPFCCYYLFFVVGFCARWLNASSSHGFTRPFLSINYLFVRNPPLFFSFLFKLFFCYLFIQFSWNLRYCWLHLSFNYYYYYSNPIGKTFGNWGDLSTKKTNMKIHSARIRKMAYIRPNKSQHPNASAP